MEDDKIVELYWQRSDVAISETAQKYGRYCYDISYNILYDRPDAEECVNDTWLHTWQALPPQRPQRLRAFLGRICRNLSLHCYEKRQSQKRGGGQLPLVLHELDECIPAAAAGAVPDELFLTELLDAFLSAQKEEDRKLFVRRYWYCSPIREIAEDFGLGQSQVKMRLLRLRKKLAHLLEEEGVNI